MDMSFKSIINKTLRISNDLLVIRKGRFGKRFLEELQEEKHGKQFEGC